MNLKSMKIGQTQIISETEHQKEFSKKMDNWDVNSPSELSEKEKPEFFEEVKDENFATVESSKVEADAQPPIKDAATKTINKLSQDISDYKDHLEKNVTLLTRMDMTPESAYSDFLNELDAQFNKWIKVWKKLK